jgi:hypothetical protein
MVIPTPDYSTTKKCAGCGNTAETCEQTCRSIKCKSTECFDQNGRCKKERNVSACKNIQHGGVSLENTGDVPEPFKKSTSTSDSAKRNLSV